MTIECEVCGCLRFYVEEKVDRNGVGVLELVCEKCGKAIVYDIGW